MKYALIIAGYALVLWGLLALRRDAARGRVDSIGERQAEIESVVEEFIAAAERAREDLKAKSSELDRLIGRADERLDRFERLAAHAQQSAASNLRTLPLPQLAERPTATATPDDPAAASAATPVPATRGRTAAVASYEAQARAAAELAAAGFPVDDDTQNDEEPAERVREAQAVRLTLAGPPGRDAGDAAAPVAETSEKKSRKKDRSRHADVYAMADAGRGVTEIARATSLSKGEVQLILDLRKAR